jgi:hypothetical protein
MGASKIIYRFHALQRMFERKVNQTEILDVIANGKLIENYPNDQPYPSRLILGYSNGRPLHLVIADSIDTGEMIVITAYEPNLEIWEQGFEIRRKP